MALTVTITNAGRAELINAQNTGTNAAVIDRIGVSSVHAAGDLKLLTALPNERKRLKTIGGEVVADDVIHVTINDTTADTYTLRTFGLYFESGTLFAVCTSVDPIMEKAAAAMLLQAVDITLTTLDTASIHFGGTGFTNPPATTERMGVVELATAEEVMAGVDTVCAVTPFGLGRALLAWAANFAAKIHGHAISDIEGLGDALAGRAAKVHSHTASDITSGTIHPDRLPSISQSKVSGLIDALNGLLEAVAGKASIGHKHDAADTTSGTFLAARIPTLAMEKISGLVDALGSRGILGNSQIWTGSNTFAGAVPVRAQQAASTGAGFVDLAGVNANRSGSVVFRNAAGERLGFVGNVDTGGTLYINADVPNIAFNRRPTFGGHLAWDAGNFDPATKVDHQAQHLSDFNAAPSSAGLSVIYAGTEPNGAPGQWAQGLQFGRARERMVQVLFDNHQNPGIYVRKTYGIPEAISWTGTVRLWHSGIFDPDSKANLVSPALLGGPTAPTPAAGDNTTRLATTAFVQREIAAIPAPGASTYTARGLIELATDAEAIAGTDQERAINPYILKRRVDARAASNAETLAGSLTDKFVTPAALWSFAKSIGSAGYQQIPGTDLIIQWGLSTGSHAEGAVHTSLPVAFGGGCLFASAIPRNVGQAYAMDFVMQIVGRYLDRIVFYANRGNSNAGNMSGYEWMAIGLARGNPDPAYSSGGGGGLPPGGGGEEPIIRPDI
ncbi:MULTISPECIES: gp53-like domain-containing protein [Brevundimonas]|uniref:gp53-like domain-containing protein n=1 Tax=Brevundimonas sp. UBA7507 TaxID=1946137 RepID=UPI00257A0645|nr:MULTISPECIES: hypothetical protein [Brevundimonas]